jgi:hypothetical protein
MYDALVVDCLQYVACSKLIVPWMLDMVGLERMY